MQNTMPPIRVPNAVFPSLFGQKDATETTLIVSVVAMPRIEDRDSAELSHKRMKSQEKMIVFSAQHSTDDMHSQNQLFAPRGLERSLNTCIILDKGMFEDELTKPQFSPDSFVSADRRKTDRGVTFCLHLV
ncbi:hypothetical protein BLNAU_19890 [Blattamonas nauphoetae]|uniref:Uncharacterized protein n=1 Tax=Blattamonas nauphoetae TaxID=2049346 RepID=A0ABQ9X093_9EUKA|nr:hypothetical protein BLNAU_19890 [Blattamonas nauphoetae]